MPLPRHSTLVSMACANDVMRQSALKKAGWGVHTMSSATLGAKVLKYSEMLTPSQKMSPDGVVSSRTGLLPEGAASAQAAASSRTAATETHAKKLMSVRTAMYGVTLSGRKGQGKWRENEERGWKTWGRGN